MKFSLLILLGCFLNSAYATNYYFSSVSGDDSRTSVQAKSLSTPWKTLSKLNSFFTSLQPGDSVLLKRGETFPGSITVTKSGTATLPIVIGAYGSGNRPVITSLVTLSNWVSKGTGIWESYDSGLGSSLNMVLLNGVEQEMGRYPNSNAVNGGYLVYESHVGKTSITDNELTSAIDWTGAELVIKPRRWILERDSITSHLNSTISYTTTSIYEPYDKYGYFIQNSIKTLDKLGEWYYNPSAKKLSVYFGAASPVAYVIQAATQPSLVSSEGYNNVAFNNLIIKGANNFGINIKKGSNISITNCDILFSGEDGIKAVVLTTLKIDNCIVSNSNNNGIDLSYTVNNAVIRNTKILKTSLLPGMGESGDANGVAFICNGDGNLAEYNELRNIGYTGVIFNGNNITIKNNWIDSFCVVKDDGAGIYSNGSSSVMYNGRKVIGNIVTNGIGNFNGTDNPTKLSVSGVYVDNEAAPVEITGNTLASCNRTGVYVHNCAGMVVKNNTVFNNALQMTFIQESDHPASVRNNVVTNNILFSKTSSQLVSSLQSDANDISYFGKFDTNYYARPLDDRITIYNHYPGSTINLDLDGWKNKYSKDAASAKTAKQIAAYKLNTLIGSNKFLNGSFTSNIKGVYASSSTLLLSLTSLMDGGCLQITPLTKKSSVYVNIGEIIGGKKYVIKYSVRGSIDTNMVINTFLRQGSSPYGVLTAVQSRKVTTSRGDNEMIFLAPSNQTSTHLVFQVDQQAIYYLDNIQAYEADATITNPNDSIKFVYNASRSNKTIGLDGDYVDTRGNKFSKHITLLPYTSGVLIRNSPSTGPVSSIPPVVNIINPLNDSRFTAPAIIKINAAASDIDGTISKVEFLCNGRHLYTAYVAPYSCTWKDVSAGTYTITAKATDNNDLTTLSSGILVVVAPQTLSRALVSTSVNTSSQPVAFSTFDNAIGLEVRPNPTVNDLYISSADFRQDRALILSIFSISGKLIKTTCKNSASQTVHLDVSALSKGNYVIRVASGNNVLYKQFVKF